MRIIFAIIKKEMLQVFRNRILTMIVLVAPIIQLAVLVFAANFEVKSVNVGIIDRDGSPLSAEIKNTLVSSGYFILKPVEKSHKAALKEFEYDKLDAIIEIPNNFEAQALRGETPIISVSINAINSMKAGVAASYIGQSMAIFGVRKAESMGFVDPSPKFEVTYSQWYNPDLDYKSFMLPGILCVLITVIGILLTSLNIVREKEVGTIEQLNVTPITKIQFILGKLIPFGIIGFAQLVAGLFLSVFMFGLDIQGSIGLILLLGTAYLFAVLGIGFLISTISENQAQAMFVTLFSMFLLTLLSGLFTPIESMADWAQTITKFNPTTYIIESIRMVVLKGSGFAEVKNNLYIIIGFAVAINTLVVLRYRKIN